MRALLRGCRNPFRNRLRSAVVVLAATSRWANSTSRSRGSPPGPAVVDRTTRVN